MLQEGPNPTLKPGPVRTKLSRAASSAHSFVPTAIGVNPTLTLVANSKMGEMILCIPASEAQRNMVDPWVETPTSVGESRLERIRHQYPCWVWAYCGGLARADAERLAWQAVGGISPPHSPQCGLSWPV